MWFQMFEFGIVIVSFLSIIIMMPRSGRISGT